jgi:hypothetical protein
MFLALQLLFNVLQDERRYKTADAAPIDGEYFNELLFSAHRLPVVFSPLLNITP